ncbi:MAG: hypothetical protein R3E95_00260 [Thiolinea sp.]
MDGSERAGKIHGSKEMGSQPILSGLPIDEHLQAYTGRMDGCPPETDGGFLTITGCVA